MDVVGRGALLDDAWRALEKDQAVALEGPAGIGKTAIHRALLDRATASGRRVLACAPTESETALPLAAVADLLLSLEAGFDTLPDAQARAARAALSGESEVDERALSAAVRTLLDDAAGCRSAPRRGRRRAVARPAERTRAAFRAAPAHRAGRRAAHAPDCGPSCGTG